MRVLPHRQTSPANLRSMELGGWLGGKVLPKQDLSLDPRCLPHCVCNSQVGRCVC